MNVVFNQLKGLIKKSDFLMAVIAKIRWQMHMRIDWWGTKIWKKTTEVVTPYGFKLRSGIHPAYKQMRIGEFEVDETNLIYRSLKRVDLFVDIGANLGYYTCLALYNKTPVMAFEPQRQNLECLFQNLIVNGWEKQVEIYPVALSDDIGLMTMYGASGPSASLIKNWADYSSSHQQMVPVTTLDNVLSGRNINCQLFIKMDVEGAEYNVLKGAVDTLGRHLKPIWLLEVCLQEFHPQGMNPHYKDIFNLFWENGYQAYSVSKTLKSVSEKDIERWVDEKSTDEKTFNYLFVGEGTCMDELFE